MTNKYYDIYKTHSDDELLAVLDKEDTYQPEVIDVVKQIIAERGIVTLLGNSQVNKADQGNPIIVEEVNNGSTNTLTNIVAYISRKINLTEKTHLVTLFILTFYFIIWARTITWELAQISYTFNVLRSELYSLFWLCYLITLFIVSISKFPLLLISLFKKPIGWMILFIKVTSDIVGNIAMVAFLIYRTYLSKNNTIIPIIPDFPIVTPYHNLSQVTFSLLFNSFIMYLVLKHSFRNSYFIETKHFMYSYVILILYVVMCVFYALRLF